MARRSQRKNNLKNKPTNTGIRPRVAAEAARIMATEGQHQYFAAKQKAAVDAEREMMKRGRRNRRRR